MKCEAIVWRGGAAEKVTIDVNYGQIAFTGSYQDLADLGIKFTAEQKKAAEASLCTLVLIMVTGHVIPIEDWIRNGHTET